jgi:S1-C subfamily serine protease
MTSNKLRDCLMEFAVVLVFSAAWCLSAQAQELPPAPRTVEEQQIIDVYRRTNPAVVFISTISLTFDVFAGLQPLEGTGSGVVIDAVRGIILTNFHVIENAKKVDVALASGEVQSAKLVGIDPEADLAVLRLPNPPANLVAVSFGDSSKLEIGQRVLAIGNPFGLNRTLSTGIVASLNRTIKRPEGSLMRGLVQIDAAINVGNSGGPLLDTAGRLIGINSAILSHSGDSAGIGFAVPTNQIKRILPELIATGKYLRPDFGWFLIDTDQGPMVHQTQPGGPAEQAGISPVLRPVNDVYMNGFVRDFRNADLIYSVNGKRVTSKDMVDDLIFELDHAEKGVLLELRRGGVKGPARRLTVVPDLR